MEFVVVELLWLAWPILHSHVEVGSRISLNFLHIHLCPLFFELQEITFPWSLIIVCFHFPEPQRLSLIQRGVIEHRAGVSEVDTVSHCEA